MNKLIMTHMQCSGQKCLVTAMETDGKLVTLQVENPQKEQLLGSIHVGKVQKVLPNLNAAFVEIENHVPCFFAYEKENHIIFRNAKKSQELKPGDELLVQVTREAIKTKAPSVSSNLNFNGNYLVLTTGNRKVGFSSKLTDKQKDSLKEMLEDVLSLERSFGVIVRTNAKEATQEQLLAEFSQLKKELESTIHRGRFLPCFTKIKDGASAISDALKNVHWETLDKIVTDDSDIYQYACSLKKQSYTHVPCEIQYYQDKLLPLYKLYSLETGLQQALSEKVWLKSGGFLIIQQTEAFVVIDVNSGKNASKKQAETEYKKINQEAASEIARQLRLRNLSGSILIDFINMKQYEDQTELLSVMKHLVKTDRVQTTVVDVTGLGIMELTRKKAEKSLAEQWKELTGGAHKYE